MGNMSKFTLILICLSLAYVSEAGFRCFWGDWACSAGCKVLGQRTGTCDDDGKCWCSEQSLNLDDLRELLPSRCTLGLAFCQGTCHAIGRRDGKCQYGEGCECSEERISPAEFAMCAAESTCRADCQRRGKLLEDVMDGAANVFPKIPMNY